MERVGGKSMKRVIYIVIVIVMVILTNRWSLPLTYNDNVTVTNYDEQTVEWTDKNGNIWEYDTDERMFIGDEYMVTFDSQNTTMIEDDVIISFVKIF